jgi:hypothetical protein
MSERIAAVIPLVRKPKSFGRSDTYTLVATESRMVFAEMTTDMMKQAVAEAQRKGKEEGKGFFARWGDQLKACMTFSDRYWDMTPDEALLENPKNYAIQNGAVKKISVKAKNDSNGPDEVGRSYTELKIESGAGKFEYKVDGHDRAIRDALRGVFGDVVK